MDILLLNNGFKLMLKWWAFEDLSDSEPLYQSTLTCYGEENDDFHIIIKCLTISSDFNMSLTTEGPSWS